LPRFHVSSVDDSRSLRFCRLRYHRARSNPNAPTYVTSLSCNGHTWTTGNCAVTGKEIGLAIDTTACNCQNPGYIARPCIGNENWGGVNTQTCSSPNPPTQTITVECK
jgi:hypothetical protein